MTKPLYRTVGVACDHAGYTVMHVIAELLQQQGYPVVEFGTDSAETSVDYPEFGARLAQGLLRGEVDVGVAACGTGNGMAMSLNRFAGVRAALCWEPALAHFARAHNDANVLVLPARYLTVEEVVPIVECFLRDDFEGGRHLRRIRLLDTLG